MLRRAISLSVVVLIVISASAVSNRLWSPKKEDQPEDITVTISEHMTVAEFGEKYELGKKALKKIFDLKSPGDLKKQVSDFGFSGRQLNKKVNQVKAVSYEAGLWDVPLTDKSSKNGQIDDK